MIFPDDAYSKILAEFILVFNTSPENENETHGPIAIFQTAPISIEDAGMFEYFLMYKENHEINTGFISDLLLK